MSHSECGFMRKLEWGEYRNVRDRIPKYWYLGPLKSKFAYVFATVQEWPPVFKAHLAYRPPVDVPEEPEVNQQQYSFFSRLFSWIWRTEQKEPEIEEVEEIPWKEVDVSMLEFSAETHNDNVENALKVKKNVNKHKHNMKTGVQSRKKSFLGDLGGWVHFRNLLTPVK
ncbi:acylglycerol kinase, mitochondrial-like [Anneissia japonica]|uniref:acylglycerol kinase, mitochondrial-like n=1 Tax=Anneissia japonica TaxID=1529436 RepID=UPI0014257C0E|nr:acylglycerol kinase, mitochondrial-like [Anneissia japonica]